MSESIYVERMYETFLLLVLHYFIQTKQSNLTHYTYNVGVLPCKKFLFNDKTDSKAVNLTCSINTKFNVN